MKSTSCALADCSACPHFNLVEMEVNCPLTLLSVALEGEELQGLIEL